MLKQLCVTDVTRMSNQRVCIGAISKQGESIRPVLPPPGIEESFLYKGEKVLRPFSLITLDLLERETPKPPHTEDWLFDRNSLRINDVLDPAKRIKFLTSILDSSVEAIFGAEIVNDRGYFIREGEGQRSLGTIRAQAILSVQYRKLGYEDKYDYRITFKDSKGIGYSLKVTDLSFQYYVDYLRQHFGKSCERISSELTEYFNKATVFLRIGLARPWKERDNNCFLQITGVYSFPDYLEGKCFADFTPRPP